MFLTSDILHARNSWTPSSMVFKQHTFPDSKNSFCTTLALEYGSAAGAPSPPLGIRINWEFYKYRWGWGFEGAHLATGLTTPQVTITSSPRLEPPVQACQCHSRGTLLPGPELSVAFQGFKESPLD